MAKELKNTTMRLDAVRREKLKDAAYDVSMAVMEVVPMSEVMKYLVDNYTDEAVKAMKENRGQ